MKYPKQEKRIQAQTSFKDTIEQLGHIYHDANSYEEFKVQADLAGLSNCNAIKWFKLYYFAVNMSIDGWINIAIAIVSGLVCTVFNFVFVKIISSFAKTAGHQALCIGLWFLIEAGIIFLNIGLAIFIRIKFDIIKKYDYYKKI